MIKQIWINDGKDSIIELPRDIDTNTIYRANVYWNPVSGTWDAQLSESPLNINDVMKATYDENGVLCPF